MSDIEAEAYRAFERWCAEHDPDGLMDNLEAAAAYSEWAGKNSIAPYLDQPSNVVTLPVVRIER